MFWKQNLHKDGNNSILITRLGVELLFAHEGEYVTITYTYKLYVQYIMIEFDSL